MSDYDAIAAARAAAGDAVLSADISNLPPGYLEGFKAILDINYHVTLAAGSTSVEGRQVTINESHTIVDGDFVGARIGQYFYYIYLTTLGDFKVDRGVPEFSDQYLYYAHPIFSWRAVGKLWVDSDNNIKYVTNDVVRGSSSFVTVAPYDATEIVDADYQCTGTDDLILLNAAIAFVNGARGGGSVTILRGTIVFGSTSAFAMKNNVMFTGEGDYSIIDTSGVSSIIDIDGVDNITLQNFSVVGGKVWKFGDTANCDNVNVNNIYFNSCGVHFIKTSSSKITNCHIANDGVISNMVYLSDTTGGAIVSGNTLISTGDNIEGVNVYAPRCVISNNAFIMSTGPSNDGIILQTSADDCVVTGNVIYDCRYGVYVASDNCIVANNIVTTATTGIYTAASANQTTIVGNDTSGATTSLSDNGTNTLLVRNDGNSYLQGGNVGIGIADPAELLEVESSAATTAIQISNSAADGDPYLAWALSGTKVFTMGVDDGDSDKLKIGTTAIGTNTRLTIDASGNVGIGTSSPDTPLEISSPFLTTLKLTATATTIADKVVIGAVDFESNDASLGSPTIVGRVQSISSNAAGTINDLALYSSYTTSLVEGLRLVATSGTTVNVGIGIAAPAAQLHVDQTSTTGAKPVLTVDQADVSEDFIRYIGTAAAANVTQSIVDNGDVTTATLRGWVKVYVQDDGNQITDQFYYQPLYTLV